MKYSELIHFEPIETVVQLRSADEETDAGRLVETFVISDRMAELLVDIAIPQLQFNRPADNKGLLVVGNYGTGKSHLMAVLSSIAEHKNLASRLSNQKVAEAAAQISGRFKVIRSEIGSTTMGLRDIVCGILEEGLQKLEVSFQFPDARQRHENKTAFQEMMAAFQEKYPDLGLILFLDELLDYLRSRKDQELSLDLSFLRELGEVCRGSRFRFISGVQESLFDNPRFQFVADTLNRVKDRFEQLRIARDDVAFVVAERLLKKNAQQKALVRDHLTRLAPLYSSMNERMEEFVRLYPIHPAYLDTFERVSIAEKREVLKTISATMKKIINNEVPPEETGLIAYDSYWSTLRDNPSFRSIPEIKEVIDKSVVLEARIQQAFPRPQQKATALRIIHGLSVHRLTTGDIYTSLGATVEELRDDLCLQLPIPEKTAEFLKTIIENVLQNIIKTVSGQFLSYNKENGQYFIDLKKDVDFESLIEKKSESLDNNQLDRYYFDALRRVVLENPDAESVFSGYRIWPHEVEWREKKAGREGWIFFGAPNQRSTAQPPKDFYLYFLQPFDAPYFRDEKLPDEIFFRLKQQDDIFTKTLRLYAGAKEMSASSSAMNKRIYEDKASEHLKTITAWLREHMPNAVEVTYQGRSKSLLEVVRGKLPANATVRDYVNTAGSVLLVPQFQDKSPDYPSFSTLVTKANRDSVTQDALRWISGSLKSKQGAAILDALELLDGDVLKPLNSRYAKHVLELLSQKGQAQVLNRSELIQPEQNVEYWTRFRLEPEFLAVVAASLVHSGDVVMSLAGKKIDAAGLDQFARLPVTEAREFKHLERPRDLPLGALQELCDLLGVPRGLIVNPATREDAVSKIQSRVNELLIKIVTAQAKLDGLVFWGKPILTEAEQSDWRSRLGGAKTFLESLQPFNTAGKLKNFTHDATSIQGQKTKLDPLKEVDELGELVQQVTPYTSYLGKAEAVLESTNTWSEEVKAKRSDLLFKIGSARHRADASFQRQLGQTLSELKAKYQDAYLQAHQGARLGVTDDRRKATLNTDPRVTQLQKLSGVEIMPTQQFNTFQNRLHGLKTCYSVSKPELEADPVCPHCGFRPVEEPPATQPLSEQLTALEAELGALVTAWTQTLLGDLEDPTVIDNIELVSDSKGKKQLKEFIKSKQLPTPPEAPFIKSLQEALSGLQKVSMTTTGLKQALAEGGLPCTVEDLEKRFEKYLKTELKGKDKTKVRIVIE